MMIVPPIFTVPNGLNVLPSPLNRRPCIMAFGTRSPPKFSYPSKVHTYSPFSVCTLQGCGNRAVARAVLDVPSAIAATRQPNAQVKARELIIVLVNFVFIVIVSFCLSFFIVLAFLASHRGRSHLAVHSFLRKILPGVAKTKILSGEPPKPTRVRASITAKAQRSARASSCRGSASPINGIKRYARRRFGRGLPTLTVLLRRWCR